jgi:hypothetical protein
MPVLQPVSAAALCGVTVRCPLARVGDVPRGLSLGSIQSAEALNPFKLHKVRL